MIIESLYAHDKTVVIMVYGVSVFWMLHKLVIGTPQQATLLVVMIAITLGFLYVYHNNTLASHASSATFVETLKDISQSEQKETGSIENKFKYAKELIGSDKVLQFALKRLGKYRDLDEDVYTTVIYGIVRFYEEYARILSGKKDFQYSMYKLYDIRRSLLNTIASLYTQVSTVKHHKDIEKIILTIQSSTYKCLNVLKNKYGTHELTHPIAHNMVGDERDLF